MIDKDREEKAEKYREELKKGILRRGLTSEEREILMESIYRINNVFPFISPISRILKPMVDNTCQTSYIDESCRIGLSPNFFHSFSLQERRYTILHEVWHVFNKHFSRGKDLGISTGLTNEAGDLEINGLFLTSKDIGRRDSEIIPIKGVLTPESYGFEDLKTLEFYATEIMKNSDKKDHRSLTDIANAYGVGVPIETDDSNSDSGESNMTGDGSSMNESNTSGDSSSNPGENNVSGNGSSNSSENNVSGDDNSNSSESSENGDGSSGTLDKIFDTIEKNILNGGENGTEIVGENVRCEEMTPSRVSDFEKAGYGEATTDVGRAVRESESRLKEEASKIAGRGSFDKEFLVNAVGKLYKPKADWRKILSKLSRVALGSIAQKGDTNKTYKRINRRHSNGDFIMPGREDFFPRIYLALDTSGSMGEEDYLKSVSEISDILKKTGKQKGLVKFFSIDTEIKEVVEISDVKDLKFIGGGGTEMSPAIAYTKSVKEPVALLVIATDGFFSSSSIIKEMEGVKFKVIFLVTTDASADKLRSELKRVHNLEVLSIEDKQM